MSGTTNFALCPRPLKTALIWKNLSSKGIICRQFRYFLKSNLYFLSLVFYAIDILKFDFLKLNFTKIPVRHVGLVPKCEDGEYLEKRTHLLPSGWTPAICSGSGRVF